MCGCESWTISKAERPRIDAFELWCWRRLLRVPWTARRSNQSILKDINRWILIAKTNAEAEALIFWPPVVKSQLTGKDPDAGKNWRQEEKGMTEDETVGWHYWLNGHEFEQALGDGEGQEIWLQSTGSQRVGHGWITKHKSIYALHQTLTFQNDDKIIKILLDCEKIS